MGKHDIQWNTKRYIVCAPLVAPNMYKSNQ